MRGPIELEWPQKAGLGMLGMPHAAVTITLALLRAWYVPTTLTLILQPKEPRRMILRTSYDYLPDMINEFHTLFLMVKLQVINETINGENTPG